MWDAESVVGTTGFGTFALETFLRVSEPLVSSSSAVADYGLDD
jgi:hypothetical protein